MSISENWQSKRTGREPRYFGRAVCRHCKITMWLRHWQFVGSTLADYYAMKHKIKQKRERINTLIFDFVFVFVSLPHVRICQSVRWQILFCFVLFLASLWVCICILHWPLRLQFWGSDEAVRIRFRGFESQHPTRKRYLWSSVRGLKDKWPVAVFRDWQAACVIGVRALERNSI